MKLKLFSFLCCALMAASVNAKIWRVDNNPGVATDFTKMQPAIDAATTDDTIMVQGSAIGYDGCTVSKRLVIIGTGYYLTENADRQYNKNQSQITTIDISASGTKILGIYATMWIDCKNNASIVIDRCIVYSIGNLGKNCLVIRSFFTHAGGNDVTFSNCVIFDPNRNGGSLSGTNMTFKNNIFGAIHVNTTKSIFTNNIFFKYGSLVRNDNAFAYNVSTGDTLKNIPTNKTVEWSQLFVCADPLTKCGSYSTDAGYQLAPNSPAIGAGMNGVDCGIFGGENPYVLSGMPPVPAIYDMKTVNGFNTIKVTVKAKSY